LRDGRHPVVTKIIEKLIDKRSVLVVEDDPDLRAAIADTLAADGHAVTVARDGHEALEILRQGARPDVILLDLTMPRMDGLEFRVQQAQDPRFAHIPVVVMTAVEAMALQAASSGLCNFLFKPIDLEQMNSVIGRWTTADPPATTA